MQSTRAGRHKLKQLQGMHASNLEQRSVTLPSATSAFEHDKMLHYKPIQDLSSDVAFQLTLRGGINSIATDDAPGRAQALKQSWKRFARTVEAARKFTESTRPEAAGQWHRYHEHIARSMVVRMPDVERRLDASFTVGDFACWRTAQHVDGAGAAQLADEGTRLCEWM